MEGWEAQIWFPLLFPQSHSAGDSNPGQNRARQALYQMGYMACTRRVPLRYNTWSPNTLISDILCGEANMFKENYE